MRAKRERERRAPEARPPVAADADARVRREKKIPTIILKTRLVASFFIFSSVPSNL
jgi:hypothetical protein